MGICGNRAKVEETVSTKEKGKRNPKKGKSPKKGEENAKGKDRDEPSTKPKLEINTGSRATEKTGENKKDRSGSVQSGSSGTGNNSGSNSVEQQSQEPPNDFEFQEGDYEEIEDISEGSIDDEEDLDDIRADTCNSDLSSDLLSEGINYVNITINGKEYRVEDGYSIHEASMAVLPENERIPTLCFHSYLPCARKYRGKCGICEVENAKTGEYLRSCNTVVQEGMSVVTNSLAVESNIEEVLKAKLSKHPLNCASCKENGFCYFQNLLQRFNISIHSLNPELRQTYVQTMQQLMMNPTTETDFVQNHSVLYDHTKCLSCYRCVRICQYVQGMHYNYSSQQGRTKEGIRKFKGLEDYHNSMFLTDCITCGMCSFVCPVNAIREVSCEKEILSILRRRREGQVVVCQVAPAVRITAAELFKLKPGSINERQLNSALKKVGFDYVFDSALGADLVAVEESEEFIRRFKEGGPWPFFTSGCSAWINLIEKHFPHYIPYLSKCKSGSAILATLIKTYWAKKMGLKRSQILVVSIMPCVGKKDEAKRPQLEGEIDYVLTTRELGRIFKICRIEVHSLRGIPFDSPLSTSSGSGVLFASSGGVMEATLRIAYERICGVSMSSFQYKLLRGLKGIKYAIVEFDNQTVKIAAVNGGKNLRTFLQEEIEGKEITEPYIVEAMACPAGCIGGGGNPKFSSKDRLKDRLKAVYPIDRRREHRKSNENPVVKKLYEEFFKGVPGCKLAKKYMYTYFTDQTRNSDEEELPEEDETKKDDGGGNNKEEESKEESKEEGEVKKEEKEEEKEENEKKEEGDGEKKEDVEKNKKEEENAVEEEKGKKEEEEKEKKEEVEKTKKEEGKVEEVKVGEEKKKTEDNK